MRVSRSVARRHAASLGLHLSAHWSGLSWDLTLEAPPGKLFAGSDCTIDCSINNAYGWDPLQKQTDWTPILRAIAVIHADGYVDDEDNGDD